MRLALATALLVALAGCSEAGGGTDETSGFTAPTTMTPTAPAPPTLPQVFPAVCDTSTGLSYGAPSLGGGSAEPATCAFAEALAGDLTPLQGAVVEAVWAPGPTVLAGNLFLHSDTCRSGTTVDTGGLHQENCMIATVQGNSPLRLDLGPDVFAAYGADNLTAYVIFSGATTAQATTIYVTLFEGMVPPGYSAIPA